MRSLEFWQEWASVTIASKPDMLRLSIALCTQWKTGLGQPEQITTNTALGHVVRRSQPAGSMCNCAVLASFNWPLSDAAGTVGIPILALPLACRQEDCSASVSTHSRHNVSCVGVHHWSRRGAAGPFAN